MPSVDFYGGLGFSRVVDVSFVLIGCAFENEQPAGGHASLQAVAEHQWVFVVGDVFQWNQVVNGLYEGGQIARLMLRGQVVIRASKPRKSMRTGRRLAVVRPVGWPDRSRVRTDDAGYVLEVIQALDTHVRIVVKLLQLKVVEISKFVSPWAPQEC